jgi:hypothetical protein
MAKRRLFIEYPVDSHEQVTVSTTAVGVTSGSVKKGGCLVRASGGTVRWRADGTDPTTGVGYPLKDGESLRLTQSSTCRAIRFIRTGQSDITLDVIHFG